jgi:hypothetical protein
MAIWTKQSGVTVYTPSRPHLFREETRAWYLRIARADSSSDLYVGVYDSLADAAAGNANYAALGTVSSPITSTDQTVTLVNNAARAPTFTNATVRLVLAATSSSGTAVWKCDLGTRMDRAVLAVHRAFSGISATNGYFITPTTVELGLKQWEDAERDGDFPYVGIAGATIFSEPGGIGYNVDSRFRIQCVAHLDHDPKDPTIMHFYDDLRRALVNAVKPATAYDGPVPNLPIWQWAELNLADKDLSLDFQTNMGTIEFDVVVVLSEHESEITGG